MTPKNKKIIIICAILILVILAILTVNSLIPKSYIQFEVAPQQVAIMVDAKNKQVMTNGGTLTVSPGKHTVVIFRDGFNPSSRSVDLKNGQTANIIASLFALTNEASKLLNNDTSAQIGETETKKDMDSYERVIQKLNPILSLLPIETRSYVITECPSEQYPNNILKIALCSRVTESDVKDVVKQDISNLGYNPDSFEYIWTVLWDTDSQGPDFSENES